MDRQNIAKLETPLLNKLITAYNQNSDDGEISVNLTNADLRALIINTKNEIAREEVLNYELFNRREQKQEYLNNSQ